MTWRAGWNVDCAAGTYAVICTGGSLAAGKMYFEATGVAFDSTAKAFIGIGNIFAQIVNPISFDVSPPSPSTGASMCGLTFGTSGAHLQGWGYPGNIPDSGTTTFATGDTVGLAVDTINSKLWWRNATTTPTTWWGKGSGSPDPVAGTDGFDFTPSTGTCPIVGNLYVIAGGGNEVVTSANDIKVNFGATSFVAAAPSGWVAWDSSGGSKLNINDRDSHIILDVNALEITGFTAIAGSNQPTAFIRSNTSKARA
jgi:hypothetical protein